MNKKFLMIFLAAAFLLAILFLVIVYFKKYNSTAISLPYVTPNATPTLTSPTPSSALDNPFVQKGNELVNDLGSIGSDVESVFKEDRRLIPPEFYIEKELAL